ncbi:MAG: metallophosphoesterase [Deltaproteobacteria bacterium]|nr:metallophosphoesterase [Deltaproteobacteria bacterium]
MKPTRGMRSSSSVLVLALVLGAASARAGEPSLAEYVFDGSRVLWFSWITDTHIDFILPLGPAGEEDRLRWATGEGFEVVQPWFMVATGDLTDSTNGISYLSGQQDAEWSLYRQIVADENGMGPEFYFDIAGNHDTYSDGAQEHYLAFSVQGVATGTTQHTWRIDAPWGASYAFVEVATSSNGGEPWLDVTQPAELTPDELAEVESFLTAGDDADLAIVFGHHPFDSFDGAGELRAAMMRHGVGHYMAGHSHDLDFASYEGGSIVQTRSDSLGQSGANNFAVVAVDADAVSWKWISLTDPPPPYPIVLITAPVDARLGAGDDFVNPWAPPVPATCTEAPVRALIFDHGDVASARFRWDGGEWTAMAQWPDQPLQWRGRFDASVLTAGLHTLEVEGTGTTTQTTVAQVEFAGGDCTVGEEDLPGADADADGDGDADADGEGGADADADADADASPDVEGETDDVENDDGGETKSAGDGCGCRAAGGGPARAVSAFFLGLTVLAAGRWFRRGTKSAAVGVRR